MFSFPGAALVAAIYFHFLLFAQFAFVHGLRESRTEGISALLALMALAGIAAGFATPSLASRIGFSRTVFTGLIASGAAAGVSALGFATGRSSVFAFSLVALATGAGIGMTTVALSAELRRLAGPRSIGLSAGAGTGLAYFGCTVSPVFNASPAIQSLLAMLVAVAGSVIAYRCRAGSHPISKGPLPEAALSGFKLGALIAAFILLVGFDSAVFAAAQSSPLFREAAWSGERQLLIIAFAAVAGALLAGILLDRARLGLVFILAYLGLAFGTWMLHGPSSGTSGAPYGAGVGMYSTALAAAAALAHGSGGAVSIARRAAWLFAIAGWIGSAIGINFAERSGMAPPWTVIPVGIALFAALALHRTAGFQPQPAESGR